jgi:Nuclease-related domain
MIFQPWALLISLPSIIVFLLLLREMKREKLRLREPFTDVLLRPPGESCRIKLEELNEKLVDWLLILAGPFALGVVMAVTSHLSFSVCLLVFVLSAFPTWVAAKRLREIARQIRTYRLGFDGERSVGQEVNQALSFGAKVYHDVQFRGYNIDHVVVAPSGVYSIETKTRRKSHDKNSHQVRYDGQKLIFLQGEDDNGLEQALRNAKTLSVWLSKAVAEPVWVEPILTLPGWLINRQAQGRVNVLNPKEIVGFISRASQTTLSPQLIQRISHQLEQKSII